MTRKPLFQDPASPYSPPSFPLPFRPRRRDSDDGVGGRHMQTLIQQISNLTIDDYESPQGEHHREQRSFVQTTTTTTTTRQPPSWMMNHPYDGSTRLLASPASSSHFSSSSTISSPRPTATAIHHDCCSTSCSDFSGAAATTTTTGRYYSKPETSDRISEVSSSSFGFGAGERGSPRSSNTRYLRTRRGAISGPTTCSSRADGLDTIMIDAREPLSGQQLERLLLSFPGNRSALSSDSSGGSRAGSSITAAIRPSTNRMNEARPLLPSPTYSSNGWTDHQDRSNSVASSSSNSRNTVRPPFSYTVPSPFSVASPVSASRSSSSHYSHQIKNGNGEITPHDSISQVGGGSPASAWAPPTAWRTAEEKRPSISLPGRSLHLSGVRHVPASEFDGSRLSPHVLRPPQQDNNGWILPSSTPGRFGPSPPSEFGARSSRGSSHLNFY
ncbi:hypothetical protein B0T20DRAFT_501470 [Sordaria brevicollis]|uniref:Uncharacterized protein n=1 Tax=Sordaria brevicollis TaxID=83679 RepID=A0AAE0PAI9_SORBR|nr:hypothetical protein B0T20DRAFT_501470 [Sordaria brevicollis]